MTPLDQFFGLSLSDVLDWDGVEELLNQKDDFRLGQAGPLHISCTRVLKDGLFKWLVYVDGKEHTFFEGGESVTHYSDLAQALEVGLSPRKHEEWEAMALTKAG